LELDFCLRTGLPAWLGTRKGAGEAGAQDRARGAVAGAAGAEAGEEEGAEAVVAEEIVLGAAARGGRRSRKHIAPRTVPQWGS
jgi:hypothetical protein